VLDAATAAPMPKTLYLGEVQMKLWMSAEFSGDIEEEIRVSSNFVEDTINEVIEAKSYDIELDSWDCIAIIMEDDDFEEITKYSPKKRDMDFRLHISHKEFSNCSSLERQCMFYQMLKRSLNILTDKGANESGVENLILDICDIAKQHGWV
jgi:stress-induced morphogen